VGEIHIGGAGVARGYLNRAELTRSAFSPIPSAPIREPACTAPGIWDGGWRTARLSFWVATTIRSRSEAFGSSWGGRGPTEDLQRGARSGVIAREHDSGDVRLVAYYTLEREAAPQPLLSAERLRAQLLLSLPAHMIPSALCIWRRCPDAQREAGSPGPAGPGCRSDGECAVPGTIGAVESAIAQICRVCWVWRAWGGMTTSSSSGPLAAGGATGLASAPAL